MKKIIVLMMVIILTIALLTSCSLLEGLSEPTMEKAEKLLDDGKYEEAIDIFDLLIDADELDFDAWFGIVDAYLEDESYKDAEDTLEEILEVIIDHYEADEFNKALEDLAEYVEEIIDEEGEIGDWYKQIATTSLDLSMYNGASYQLDERLFLDIPENMTAYYTLDGGKVSADSTLYEDGIHFEGEGDLILTVAVYNGLGIKGEETMATIIVGNGGTLPDTPTANYDSGTYEGPIDLYFSGYDSDSTTLYYVLDGSDQDGDLYVKDTPIFLDIGYYDIVAFVQDNTTGAYSEPLIETIQVIKSNPVTDIETIDLGFNNKVILEFGLLDVLDNTSDEVTWAVSEFDAIYDDVSVNITYYDTYTQLRSAYDAGNGPDVVFTWSQNIMDLYYYMGPVKNIVNMDLFHYYPGVEDSTYYWDDYYCLPIITRPSGLIFYESVESTNYYPNGITYEEMLNEMNIDPSTQGLVLPHLNRPEDFLSFYLANGGLIYGRGFNVTLDRQPLIETLNEYKSLVNIGALDPYSDFNTWEDALEKGNVDFILADPMEYMMNFMSYDYEIAGHLPLSNGNLAAMPHYVEGLLIENSVSLNPTSDKAIAIQFLYELLALNTYYNGYIASYSGAMPAITELTNDYDYYYPMNFELYESIINNTPADHIDLVVTWNYAVEIQTVIADVAKGTLTPEAGADMIIQAIENEDFE